MAGVSGTAVAAAAGGTLLIWSGLRGASLSGGLRDLISGAAPSGADENPVGTPLASGGSAGESVDPLPVPMAAGPGAYSNAQLRSLWVLAGGTAATAPVAACIAQHESSGQPKVTSGNPDGGQNVGLWQLDTKGKGAGHTVAQLQDPLTNARLAVQGSAGGTDWSAWATASMCGV